MFVKPSDEVTTALARIAKSAEWEVYENWLLASREAFVKSSLQDDAGKSRQAQGGFAAIDELLRHTKAALELSTARR